MYVYKPLFVYTVLLLTSQFNMWITTWVHDLLV